MTTDTPPTHLVEQLTELVEIFSTIATGDGLAPLLFLIGAALVGFSMAFAGYLSAGAAVDLVTRQ